MTRGIRCMTRRIDAEAFTSALTAAELRVCSDHSESACTVPCRCGCVPMPPRLVVAVRRRCMAMQALCLRVVCGTHGVQVDFSDLPASIAVHEHCTELTVRRASSALQHALRCSALQCRRAARFDGIEKRSLSQSLPSPLQPGLATDRTVTAGDSDGTACEGRGTAARADGCRVLSGVGAAGAAAMAVGRRAGVHCVLGLASGRNQKGHAGACDGDMQRAICSVRHAACDMQRARYHVMLNRLGNIAALHVHPSACLRPCDAMRRRRECCVSRDAAEIPCIRTENEYTMRCACIAAGRQEHIGRRMGGACTRPCSSAPSCAQRTTPHGTAPCSGSGGVSAAQSTHLRPTLRATASIRTGGDRLRCDGAYPSAD